MSKRVDTEEKKKVEGGIIALGAFLLFILLQVFRLLIKLENFKSPVTAHLTDDSILNGMNHINWRQFQMRKSLASEVDVHYSSVFTIAKVDVVKLRENLMSFIQDQREHIGESGSVVTVSFRCNCTVF